MSQNSCFFFFFLNTFLGFTFVNVELFKRFFKLKKSCQSNDSTEFDNCITIIKNKSYLLPTNCNIANLIAYTIEPSRPTTSWRTVLNVP